MKNVTVDKLKTLQGEIFEPTPWMSITQDMVNTYGKLVGDEQWIHCDPERAAKESPFKTTIAHGILSASYIPLFVGQCIQFKDAKLMVNYGMDNIRFPHPVPTNGEIRGIVSVENVESFADGGQKITFAVKIELKNIDKPACVASITMIAW